MKRKPLILISSSLLLIVLAFNACSSSGGTGSSSGIVPITSQGTSLGNPMVVSEKVEIRVAPFPPSFSQHLKPLMSVNICVKEIRLKTHEADSSGATVSLDTPQIALEPGGTFLASLGVPEGTYSRIEIDLDNHCASGVSFSVSTPFGTFAVKEPVTLPLAIKLSVASGAGNLLELDIEQILNAMAAGAADLKALLAAVFGSA